MARALTTADIEAVTQDQDQYVADVIAGHYLDRQPYYGLDTDLARRRHTLPRIAALDLERARSTDGGVLAVPDLLAVLVYTRHEEQIAPQHADAQLETAAGILASRLIGFRARCRTQQNEILGGREHLRITHLACAPALGRDHHRALLIDHQIQQADADRLPRLAFAEDTEAAMLLSARGFEPAGRAVPVTSAHAVQPMLYEPGTP